jgi:hypothetical protein
VQLVQESRLLLLEPLVLDEACQPLQVVGPHVLSYSLFSR